MKQMFPKIGFYLDEEEVDFLKLSFVGKLVFAVSSAEYFFSSKCAQKKIYSWRSESWWFHRNVLDRSWSFCFKNYSRINDNVEVIDPDFFSKETFEKFQEHIPDDEDPSWSGGVIAQDAAILSAIAFDIGFEREASRIISLSRYCLNNRDAIFSGTDRFDEMVNIEKARQRQLFDTLTSGKFTILDLQMIRYNSVMSPLVT